MRNHKPVVIVTGSEGAIGSALCHALEGRFRVVGVDRDCEDCVAVDLTSDESVRLGLAEIKKQHSDRIASVLHLAAYFDLSGEPNPLYDAVNVDGTRRLLSALQGFDVEQFVYASTMLVHAPTRPGLPIAVGSGVRSAPGALADKSPAPECVERAWQVADGVAPWAQTSISTQQQPRRVFQVYPF